jgi:glycosyltransferase involved in cell wall biosynthesis
MAGEASYLAEGKFYDQALGKMRAAEECLTYDIRTQNNSTARFVRRSECLTIAIVADVGLNQCEFYRVDQKVEHIRRAGYVALKFDFRTDLLEFRRSILEVDAVIFYRVPGTPDVIDAISFARRANIPTIYEIDDLMFDPEHFPDSFESYGGQISNEMYSGLVIGTESLAAAMSVCDYGLSSTSTLAVMMRPHVMSNRVFLHRNAFSRLHEVCRLKASKRPKRLDGVTYIFYGTGTKAHNSDFEDDCAPALARLFEEFGSSLHLVIVGYITLPQVLIPHRGRITLIEPIWDLAAYWNLLSTMDINLSVLKPSLMADCKSEIKWLEAAMFKVPTAMMATATHLDVAQDGTAAALVRHQEEWYTVLRSLVKDSRKREAIASAAYDLALSKYNIDCMGENIKTIFGSIVPTDCRPRRHRVLVVNVFFPPQSIGGATRVVRDNVKFFRDHYSDEFEIEVFATVEGGLTPYEVNRYIWAGTPVTAVSTPLDPDIDRKISDPTMDEVFSRLLDRFKPDLVHLHCIQRITSSICDVMVSRGIPYIVTAHDAWWISDKQFLLDEIGEYEIYDYERPLNVLSQQGVTAFERMCQLQGHLAGAARVISVSAAFASIYESCGFTNVLVLENGVTPFDVEPRGVREIGSPVRLGYLGGLSLHKGYNLIRAALSTSDFRNLELLVIDHAMSAGTERLTTWGGTLVRFRGKEPQESVASLYARIDVLVAPSVWPESYGLVTREAARAGCWVVASDRGAVSADIACGSGTVIQVIDYTDLKRVLSDISANPDSYRTSSVGTPPLRTADDQAREVRDVYLDVLQGSSLMDGLALSDLTYRVDHLT